MSTDLSDLMQQATATIAVDTDRLVRGGLERGAARVRRRRGRRIVAWSAGAAAATVLVGVAVPPWLSGSDSAREVRPTGSSTLRLLPDDVVDQRFADLLPGTSSPISVTSSTEAEMVSIDRRLVGPGGMIGLVQGAFGVFEPMTPENIAEAKRTCREAQTKVGPKDGTDCQVVRDGTVMSWDDTVPPEDPGDDAPGVRMAYAYLSRWDGSTATMWSYNTPDRAVSPAPGTDPVLRTGDLVDLVQRLEFYVLK